MIIDELRVVGSIFKVIVTVFPWILGIVGLHQWLYTKSPKYYFTFIKLFSKRKDTKWQVTATLKVSREADFFGAFQKIVKDKFGRYNRKFNLQNKKHYEFGNFASTIFYDIDFSEGQYVNVDITFDQLNVTLENAKDRLRELRILFSELEKELQPVGKHYNVNIEFTSMKNPFYGLMIQRLGEEHIEYFECVFPISLLLNKHAKKGNKNEYKLRIFKEKISITESNFDIIEDIVIDSLLLR